MSFQFSNLNILLVSPEPWTHLSVSKHHYARALAEKGNNVVFLNPPSKELAIASVDIPNLSAFNYRGFIPGFRFWPTFIRKLMVRNMLRKIEIKAQCKFDLIWSFDNSVFFDLDAFPAHVKTISHIVDKGQNFQFKRASESADICFGVIQEIVDAQLRYNSKSYLISHGVNLPTEIVKQKHLPGKHDKKVLYFGNLGMKSLDWSLLKEAIQRFVDVDFILIGDNHESVPIRVSTENFHLIEKVASGELWSYMYAADILFLFYDESYMEQFASPHKLMEYLGSGKPIVSGYFEEYKEFKHLINMSRSKDQWLNNFESTLHNLADKSNVKLTDQRKSIAMDRTYARQLERIEKIIASQHVWP